jgi:hypothetical protein
LCTDSRSFGLATRTVEEQISETSIEHQYVQDRDECSDSGRSGSRLVGAFYRHVGSLACPPHTSQGDFSHHWCIYVLLFDLDSHRANGARMEIPRNHRLDPDIRVSSVLADTPKFSCPILPVRSLSKVNTSKKFTLADFSRLPRRSSSPTTRNICATSSPARGAMFIAYRCRPLKLRRSVMSTFYPSLQTHQRKQI